MAQEAKELHPLGFEHWRNRRGWPTFSQRLREAWWIITGRWSLHRAWQVGHDGGTHSEWRRVIINMGDIDAQRRNVAKADVNIARSRGLTPFYAEER